MEFWTINNSKFIKSSIFVNIKSSKSNQLFFAPLTPNSKSINAKIFGSKQSIYDNSVLLISADVITAFIWSCRTINSLIPNWQLNVDCYACSMFKKYLIHFKSYCSASYMPLFHQCLTQMIFNSVGTLPHFVGIISYIRLLTGWGTSNKRNKDRCIIQNCFRRSYIKGVYWSEKDRNLIWCISEGAPMQLVFQDA